MAFIPVPDTAECALHFMLHGQQIVNTLCFTKTGGFSGSDLLDLATALDLWWEGKIAPEVSQDITLVSVTARDISEESGPVSEFFLPGPYPGQVASPALPGNVAWSVGFKTGLAGRSFRGRNYVGGIAESSVVGNTLNVLVAAAILAGYAQINTVISAELAAIHVVASRFHANAPRVTGVATAVETYGYADLYIDSMRRRLTGRGT